MANGAKSTGNIGALGQDGEEVADFALDWAEAHARPAAEKQAAGA